MSTDAAYVAEVLWCLSPGTPEPAADESVAARYGELLARIRTDDAEAFKELIAALAQPLVLYARRFSAAVDNAEDLVQDVFLYVWEQRYTLQVRGSFRSYLYTVVRHRALNVRKHDNAEAARIAAVHVDGNVPGMGQGPGRTEAAVERREIAARVAAAFTALPPRAREVALLRWHDSLSYAEIAAVMGISARTVNNHLTLATQTMRTLLEDLRDSH